MDSVYPTPAEKQPDPMLDKIMFDILEKGQVVEINGVLVRTTPSAAVIKQLREWIDARRDRGAATSPVAALLKKISSEQAAMPPVSEEPDAASH